MDLIELKTVPYRKDVRSNLVFLEEGSLRAIFCLDVGEVDVLYAIGILQMPLDQFLWPEIISLQSLMIFTWYLVNMEVKSLSKSSPIEMRELVAKLYIM